MEYGILIQDELAMEIRNDYLTIFNNPYYPKITYKVIDKAERILQSVPKEKQKNLNINDSELFNDLLNDENIEEKFDGGSASIISNLAPWRKDVFECLQKINSDVFTLEKVYSFEQNLNYLHPDNHHIRDKIRQQLQYLRDLGLVEFIKPGIYKKLWI